MAEHYASIVAKWPNIILLVLIVPIANYAYDFFGRENDVNKLFTLYAMKTPYGHTQLDVHLIYCIYEIIVAITLCTSLIQFVSMFIAPLFYIDAFCVDCNKIFDNLDDILTNRRLPNSSTLIDQIICSLIQIQFKIIE